VIFFDNKGSIIKFNNSSKIVWKQNYYSKVERKMKPILFLSNNNDTLFVADNISKYYALDINSGKLLWSRNNTAPFNSQVKVYKDRIFVIDFENILRCYSVKNGNELWKIRTEKSFIKSQKKLSLVAVGDKIVFNNSIGDISAVDIDTGNLIWQQPTQSSEIYEDSFLLKTSDIIASNKSILFSNNKNEFFSIDINSGGIKWKQKINSTLRHTLTDDIIFSISMEGFLIITNNKNGGIIRITDVFKQFSKKKRSKIKPVGFVVGARNIYLTTDNGRLLIIDILTGKTKSVLKIDGEKISRPFVLNKNMFIIKDKAIIRLN
jgi:outer membrane protein assembly factor BamB